MEVEIYERKSGFQYEVTAILDGWISLQTYDNYYKANTFKLDTAVTQENIANLKVENLLLIDGVMYFIDDVKADEEILSVEGSSLSGKSANRIIDRIYTATKSPALIVWDHFSQEMISPSDTKRKYNYLTLSTADGLGLDSIDYQVSYELVSEQVESLCSTYDFGYREEATDTAGNLITIYKGRDLTEVVEISDDFENLLNVKYEHNNFDQMTTAVVLGEGEGAARKKVVVNPALAGIERRELYVDARDVQSTDPNTNVTFSATTYTNMLTDRGKQKLTERTEILTMTGDIALNSKLYEYGVDFKTGDRVRLSSNLYQVAKSVVIATAHTTYDVEGKHTELVFDRETPLIYQILGRK